MAVLIDSSVLWSIVGCLIPSLVVLRCVLIASNITELRRSMMGIDNNNDIDGGDGGSRWADDDDDDGGGAN